MVIVATRYRTFELKEGVNVMLLPPFLFNLID